MVSLNLTNLAKMVNIPESLEENMSQVDIQVLKKSLEKAIPRMHCPNVNIKSFVGLEDIKTDLLAGFDCGEKESEKILLYGPLGSGKSHLASALCTKLDALLFTIDKTTFQSWSKRLEAFTKAFSEIAGSSFGNGVKGQRVVLLLENFQWFYENAEELNSVVDLLATVQNCWKKHSPDSKLLVIACGCEPWTLDKMLIDSFQKRVYLRPLNFEERKQLIQKTSCDLLCQWGLDMTDRELCEVTKRVERFAGWQVCEMVEKAYRLQCPPHINKKLVIPRPLTKVDFEVTLDRMPTGGNGRELMKKYEEFYRICEESGAGIGKSLVTYEDKGVQTEVIKKNNGKLLASLFKRIEI